MEDIKTIRDKINDWLLDEGLTVSQREDEQADFHLVIPDVSQGITADIIKPKNKYFLIIGIGIGIPPEVARPYASLKDDEKQKFMLDVQKDLLIFQVDHRIEPNRNEPKLIAINDLIYIEDITRTSFMTSLKRVKFATLYLIWSINEKFSPQKGSSNPSSGYA